jgi:hypothetical protein
MPMHLTLYRRFANAVPPNAAVLGTENKGSTRKFRYSIKSVNKIQKETKVGARSKNSTFQYQAKHKKNPRTKKKQICGILVFKIQFSCTLNMICVSKHVKLYNMFISYPCLTFICCYPYLFVV